VRIKTDEKRQEIVAVARDVFRQKGYAEASMAEISARLGGSKGTLYSYFSSKEELFLSVMLDMAHRTAGPILGELETASDMKAGLGPFMHKLMQAMCSAELIDFRRMLIGEAGRTQLGKLMFEQGPKQYLQTFADLFEAEVRAGRFRDVDPWRAAMHMQSLGMGAPVAWVLEGIIEKPSDEELAQAAQAATDVFLRAYALEQPAGSN
jgi:AcrR family transcriptional regulator